MHSQHHHLRVEGFLAFQRILRAGVRGAQGSQNLKKASQETFVEGVHKLGGKGPECLCLFRWTGAAQMLWSNKMRGPQSGRGSDISSLASSDLAEF